MHFFEEEYQRRFKNSGSSKGIDSEQLWNDISSELDQPSNRKKVLLWWSLLAAAILLVLNLYYSEQDNIQEQQLATPLLPPNHCQPESLTISPLCPPVAEWVNEGEKSFPEEQQMALKEKPTLPPSTTDLKEPNQNIFQNNTTIDPITIAIATQYPIQKEIDLGIKNEQTSTLSALPNKKLQTTPGLDRKAIAIKSLPTLIFTANRIHQLQLETPPLLPLNPNSKTKRMPIQWGVIASAFTWKDHYQGENTPQSFAAELATAHQSLGSYSTGFQVEYPIKQSWSLVTGLQLQKTYSSFEWSRNWDTIMYRNNIPGSDIINALGMRQVEHQNEIKTLHLPLMVGYEAKSNNNWHFGLQLGVSFNYLIEQKGKTLRDETTVIAFQQPTSGPYKRFFISGQCSPYLSCQVGARTQLRLHGQFSYQWHRTSPLYQIKHTSLTLGGGVGIYHSL